MSYRRNEYEPPVYWAGTEKLTEREMSVMVRNYREDGAVVVPRSTATRSS